MLRRFVTLDGEIQAEEEWDLNNPSAKCFYCDRHLMLIQSEPCPIGFSGLHDYITLVHPVM